MQEKISSFCSYLTAGVFAGFGALTLQDWVSLLGLLFVALTYFTNRYYKKKSYEVLKKHPELANLYEKISD
ncbi:HP1 family phage holin [Vibrio cholerae]